MKKIAILLILNFLFSLFNVISVEAAMGCCEKLTIGGTCQYVDETQCNVDSGGFVQGLRCDSPFIPSNIKCKVGCCIIGDSASITREVDCNDRFSYGACSADYTTKGGCFFNGECIDYISLAGCRSRLNSIRSGNINLEGVVERGSAVQYGFKNYFDKNIMSSNVCRLAESAASGRGCCKSGNYCLMSAMDTCSGQFSPYTFCSNIGGCSCGEVRERCVREDNKYSVYYYDDCGLRNKKEDCSGGKGRCIEDTSGVRCVTSDCIEGNEFVIKRYSSGGVLLEEKKEKITKDMLGEDAYNLGGKAYRRNKDEWCIKPKGNYIKFSAGTRYYVYSCVNGEVINIESCGIYRDTVCKESESDGSNYDVRQGVKCYDNQWEDCTGCGEGEGHWWQLGFVGGCDKEECKNLGDCHFDTKIKNECWPRYPPGYEFWKENAEDDQSGNERRCSRTHPLGCGGGGDSKLSACDENECYHMGDCSFDAGWNPWVAGISAGVAAGLATYAGGAYGPDLIAKIPALFEKAAPVVVPVVVEPPPFLA